jgi:hypothetical protein
MNISSTLVGEVVVTMFLLSVSWRFSSSNASDYRISFTTQRTETQINELDTEE